VILRRLLAADPSPPDYRDPTDERYWGTDSVRSASGAVISADGAMRCSVAFACSRVLAESVAQLPIGLYRRVDRSRERVRDDLARLLTRKPNGWQSAFEFKELLTMCAANRGNGFAEFVPDPAFGPLGRLEPIVPEYVTTEQLTSKRLRYIIRDPNRGERTLTQDEVFHLRGPSMNGITGMSIISYAREGIGLSITSERFAARQFSRRPMHAGVLEVPATFKDLEASRRMADSFQRAYSGEAGWFRPAVLEGGAKYTSVGISPQDAQFLEGRKFQVPEICRWYRVPPHLVMDLEKATFSNIEHQDLGFVKHTLVPWLRRWEGALWRDFDLDDEEYFEFIVDALLRGDTLSRATANRIATGGAAWKSPAEVRETENLPYMEGLDEVRQPLNTAAPDRLVDGGAKPNNDPGAPKDA